MDTVDDIGYGRQFGSFYDRIFPKDASADRTAEKLASLHPGAGLRSLELGVGTGRIAVPLAARVGTVVGVDSSPEMLDQLRSEVRDAGADVLPVHDDIRTYADDDQYGMIYCVCATLSMLLEAEQQQEAISRAATCLAPGGVLVVETHNRDGVLAMLEGKQNTSFFTPYPELNTGLLTYSRLSPDQRLWQASHIWFEGGGSYVGTELSRLTTPDEVDGYAAAAGLKPVERWADWQGTPYSEDGTMFISVHAHTG
ncbi:class I SAM-dependent methyltransferase [Actinopolyspora saharensis]|uniref:class I SAM-dependent methyltransferase n=1 Tax=Actinopolyspora saharensis TaxID=995062 RepID=UPI003F676296